MPQVPASLPKLNICFATAELAPLAKTGGLADVSYALAAYFQGSGHDARVLMPRYGSIDLGLFDPQPIAELQARQIDLGGRSLTYSILKIRLEEDGPEVHLLECPEMYGGNPYGGDDEHLRFILLSRVALEMCVATGFSPDIFHCHDWHTALIPLYLKTVYQAQACLEKTRSVLTLHNIGYQGVFGTDVLDSAGLAGYIDLLDGMDHEQGRVNFLKTGVMHADLLTTVSPTYAREILHAEYGMGLEWHLAQRSDALVGILNGVDYSEWSPESDPLIPHSYSARMLQGKERNKRSVMEEMGVDYRFDRPLLGVVSRLAHQKGIELMQQALPELLRRRDFSLVVIGSGEEAYVHFFEQLAAEFPDRVGFFHGYNNALAHRVEAGSDMFLMPSRYEPCGLNQMYSLRYGTVPVVRATGGLADSVKHFDPGSGAGTGVVFHDFDANGLRWAIETALDFYANKRDWRRMVANGMAVNYSWDEQGSLYEQQFCRLSGAD